MVSGSVSSPSRGAFHLSLTVLVHYRLHEVFSLGGWSPQLPTRFHVSRGTQDPGPVKRPSSTGLSPAMVARSSAFKWSFALFASPTTPPMPKHGWFGLFPVRSPLLRESRLISLVRLLRCFSSPTSLHNAYVFSAVYPDITLDGLPHSESWGSWLGCSSPQTFRRSPRPSSVSCT